MRSVPSDWSQSASVRGCSLDQDQQDPAEEWREEGVADAVLPDASQRTRQSGSATEPEEDQLDHGERAMVYLTRDCALRSKFVPSD